MTECYKDARLLRAKKKRRNNPLTQQLQRAAETYSVDQTRHCTQGVPVLMALWENSENFKPRLTLLLCDF